MPTEADPLELELSLQLSAAMWVLRTELRFLARVGSALTAEPLLPLLASASTVFTLIEDASSSCIIIVVL